MERNIDHFLHQHPLTLIEKVNHRNKCLGCGRYLLQGPIYGCHRCMIYLHEACTEFPKEIQHFIHPCPLILDLVMFSCYCCSSGRYGFCYRCTSCKFKMNTECALWSNIKPDGYGVQHFTHLHPLRLMDERWRKDYLLRYDYIREYLQFVCSICKNLICFDSDSTSAAYGCDRYCSFFLHKSCMINIPQQINHAFHPSCPLILLKGSLCCRSCQGCGADFTFCRNFVFHCGKCGFELDVKCALLPTLEQSKDAKMIQYAAHKHPLVAVRDITASEVDHGCGICGEKWSLELQLHEDPCFGCKRCHLFLHKSCMMTIPQQINDHSSTHHVLSLCSHLHLPTRARVVMMNTSPPWPITVKSVDFNWM